MGANQELRRRSWRKFCREATAMRSRWRSTAFIAIRVLIAGIAADVAWVCTRSESALAPARQRLNPIPQTYKLG